MTVVQVNWKHLIDVGREYKAMHAKPLPDARSTRKTFQFHVMTPFKGIRILESRNFSLWNPESWGLESGIRLKESGIPQKIDWNPESKFHRQRSGIHDVESRIQLRKKFKSVAHSNENTSSRFCLNVLKLMMWTGSIYFKANLTLSFVGLSKDRFCRSNFEQTFSLNESYFVSFYIICLIHELGLRASSRESREVTRERTRVRGASPPSHAFSRGFKLPFTFLGEASTCEQWTWINLRMGLELLLVCKRIPRNIDNEN